MARVAVSAGLALAFVSTGEAFAFSAPHALAQRRGATPQLRQATAAHVRPQQRGALHAQLRPEDEQMKSARPKFELGNAWQDFVGAAREGWATGADARATASLPNVFLVPVWIGVAAMGLFLPAPQLLESMFMGMNHGLVTPSHTPKHAHLTRQYVSHACEYCTRSERRVSAVQSKLDRCRCICTFMCINMVLTKPYLLDTTQV